ncbi:hypothetical protein R3P38DRAFT_3297942 [Favolaschia claudopus]|uniref:F-box domain-containing protein n=1 Tax=Favolaschia claudopus TaxID=2862362 RepID=A0AAV9Z5I3_9AGAR
MDPPNPLKVQELLDRTIGFLADNTSDLLACALVAHSWLHPSQSTLLYAPHRHLGSNQDIDKIFGQQWRKCYNTMVSWPHLLPLVRHLYLNPNRLHPQNVELICGLALTRLRSVKVDVPKPDKALRKSLQLLLGRTSLRHLDLYFSCSIVDCMETLQQHRRWTAMRYLELGVPFTPNQLLAFRVNPPHSPSRLPVLALNLLFWVPFGLRQPEDNRTLRTSSLLYAFDMTQLRALRLQYDWDIMLVWDLVPQNAIEVLDMLIHDTLTSSLDLSDFPNLRFLRLEIPSDLPAITLSTLRSLAPSQHLQTLVICMGSVSPSNEPRLVELDELVASLPVTTVELEEKTIYYRPSPSQFFLKSVAQLGNSFSTISDAEPGSTRFWRLTCLHEKFVGSL